MKIKYLDENIYYGENSDSKREETTTVECDCGSKTFFVNWIEYPHTGGYCKVTCVKCQSNHVLIDDYA